MSPELRDAYRTIAWYEDEIHRLERENERQREVEDDRQFCYQCGARTKINRNPEDIPHGTEVVVYTAHGRYLAEIEGDVIVCCSDGLMKRCVVPSEVIAWFAIPSVEDL